MAVALLALAGCLQAANNEDPADWELKEGFDDLESYIRDNFKPSDEGSLKAAKKASSLLSLQSGRVRLAAKSYVRLAEVNTCSANTLKYMDYVLTGRRAGRRGAKAHTRRYHEPRDKSRFERLLEPILERAGNICSTFINSWFEKSEAKLDPTTKQKLYTVMDGEQAMRGDLSKNLIKVCVDKTISDANTKEKLLQMNHDGLYRFYANCIEENFLRPCNRYVEVMSPVLSRAYRLGALNDVEQFSEFFGQPSLKLKEAVTRYRECEHQIGLQSSFLDIKAKRLVDEFEQRKSSL